MKFQVVLTQEPASLIQEIEEPVDEATSGADTQKLASPVQEIEEPLDEATSDVDKQRPTSPVQVIMEPLKEFGAAVDTAPQEPVLADTSVVEAMNMGSPAELVAKDLC